MVNSYHKTGQDTLYRVIPFVAQFATGLLVLPLITKTLGVHDYGIWSQVNVTISLILPFTNLGLSDAMMRFLAAEKNKETVQEGFYSVLGVTFIVNLVAALLIGIILVSPLADGFFSGAVQVVRITAILVLISSLNTVCLVLIQTFQQIRRHSIITAFQNGALFGLIAYLVLHGYGILSVVLTLVVVNATLLVSLLSIIKSEIGIKRPNFSLIRKYLSYGLPLVPRGISVWMVNLSDRYVISFFLGISSVGVYSAGYVMGVFPQSILGLLNFVLVVRLCHLYDNGKLAEVKTHLSYSLKYFLAIAIPFIFGAVLLAGPVLRLLSTAEIAAQGAIITPVIALATLLYGVYALIEHILRLVKKTKMLAVTWVIAASLNIGLNIVLVPRLGIIGAAITTLIAYALALGMVIYYAFKEFRFPIDWRFIRKSVIASAVMAVAVWLMAPQGNLDTVVTVLAGIAIYGGILIALKGFSKTEFRFFRGLVRGRTSTTDSEEDVS